MEDLIDVNEFVDNWWVVKFSGDCGETVLRQGTKEEVSYPDDLGCPLYSVEPLKDYDVVDVWIKNDQVRANVVKKAPVVQLAETTDLNPVK